MNLFDASQLHTAITTGASALSCLVGLYVLRLASFKVHRAAQQRQRPHLVPTEGPGVAPAGRWELIRRYVANEVTMSDRIPARNASETFPGR